MECRKQIWFGFLIGIFVGSVMTGLLRSARCRHYSEGGEPSGVGGGMGSNEDGRFVAVGAARMDKSERMSVAKRRPR